MSEIKQSVPTVLRLVPELFPPPLEWCCFLEGQDLCLLGSIVILSNLQQIQDLGSSLSTNDKWFCVHVIMIILPQSKDIYCKSGFLLGPYLWFLSSFLLLFFKTL